jgi:YedE family putative selenium metabolism protein
LNALVGVAGFAVGIFIAAQFIKGGYTLGRTAATPALVGWIMPMLSIGLLLLLLFKPAVIRFSEKGPGAMHAPLICALTAGLLVGLLAHRTRLCTVGALRDVFIMRSTHLLAGVLAMLAAAFLVKLSFGMVKLSFIGQPIAHSNHLWNFLGMVLSGLAFALAGGCPGRQLILSGEGDADAGVFVLGAVTGAALAHNLKIVGAPDKMVDGAVQVGGLAPAGQAAVVAGIAICLGIGFFMREK